MINHLWQSTAFAILAAILTLAFRRNKAQVRYWLWFGASLKFLVPFSLLIALGSRLELRVPQVSSARFSAPLAEIAQPFPDTAPFIPPAPNSTDWVPLAVFGLWVCGSAAIVLMRLRGWLRVRAAVHSSAPLEIPLPVEVRSAPGLLEPGVVGFLRPILLLPEGIADRLTPGQLEAVLAHELSHVRRRDNLTSAIHMIVEAVFWFHPLVWWIGARLVDERERACDEAVLSLGNEPQVYAEGILNVCKIYLESPLRCVSGITGSDLKKRIQAILTGRVAGELNSAKRVVLAFAGIAALALPVLVGILTAPVIRAQIAPANTPRFEVASIRACGEPENGPAPNSSPGRLATDCVELLNLIGNAYTSFADGRFNPNSENAPINGGPAWLKSASYDIKARAEGNPSVPMMLGPMMQRLLEDRFQLKIHRETREGPVYFLTVARGGPKLQRFAEGSCTPWTVPPPPLEKGARYCANLISVLSPSVEAPGTTLDEFSKTLRTVVDRPVIDKTGIAGRFDIRVKFSREGTSLGMPRIVGPAPASKGPAAASDPAGPPSIFVALQEQLGLRLESGRGPIETLVIDHIERPTEN